MFRIIAACALLVAYGVFACGDDDGADTARDDTGSARDAAAAAPTATAAEIEELTKLTVPGYVATEATQTLLGGAVIYTADKPTAGGGTLLVRVNLAPCDGFICAPLDPKQYDSPEAMRNLKSILPATHIDNPDLRFEFGTVDLSNSAEGLEFYALSYVEKRGADGSVGRSTANTYRAWYHNGGVYITLEVFSRSATSVLSLDELESRMTKAEAQQAAKDVFAVIEPQLPKN